jgi:dUTP pyrophosphatase
MVEPMQPIKRRHQFNSQIPPHIGRTQWNGWSDNRKLRERNAYNRSVGLPEWERLFTRDELNNLRACAVAQIDDSDLESSSESGQLENGCVAREVKPSPPPWQARDDASKPPEQALVQKLTQTAKLPRKSRSADPGYAICADEAITIQPGAKSSIETGIKVVPPPGTYARIAPWSGIGPNMATQLGAEVNDDSYCGCIRVSIFNHSKKDFKVNMGDVIAQIVFERVSNPIIKEVDVFASPQMESVNEVGVNADVSSATPCRAADVSKDPDLLQKVEAELEQKADELELLTNEGAMQTRKRQTTNDSDSSESGDDVIPRAVNAKDNKFASACMVIPHMPTIGAGEVDQEDMGALQHADLKLQAFVARTVGKSEIASTPEANAACKKEWDKLIAKTCWDTEAVKPWRAVCKKANEDGVEVHIGSLHELCMEKGSELEKGS